MKDELYKPLKQARKNLGLTQGEVAEMVDTTTSTLGNYERGYSEPDLETYIKLCKIYGLDFYAMIESTYGISGFTPEEVILIQKYRVLGPREKSIVDSAMRFVVVEK